MNKEITIAKIIERTAKRDAYKAVMLWEGSKKEGDTSYGSAYWYAKEKYEGHKIYLDELNVYYDYGNQTLVPKPAKTEEAK